MTGTVSIGVVLVALFLLATAEVFADNASQTLLPMLVRREDLALANARIQAGFVTINQLAGPPHRRGAVRDRHGPGRSSARRSWSPPVPLLVSRIALPRASP